MKKFSTGMILAVGIICLLLNLGVALGIQWYHLLHDTTAKEVPHDTTKIVSTKVVELHQYGYTVEYNGMQYNISADISQIKLTDTVRIKIDMQGTETPFDDTFVCVFEN